MNKIELAQIEKITPENSGFIEEESIKKEHLEIQIQEKLDFMAQHSELPMINANPQDTAEVVLYVKMPDGTLTPHRCPLTYIAEYVKDYLTNGTIIGG